MKTNQIDVILKQIISPALCNFLGVFPIDLIPSFNNIKFPACLVANTDPSTKPGTHWVAIYLESPNKIEFFDSYGLHPSVYGFSFSVVKYNQSQLQSFTSNVCGQYCIYYLFKRSRCSCIFSKEFSTNSDNNDILIVKWFKKISFSPHIPCCTKPCIQTCKCRKQ